MFYPCTSSTWIISLKFFLNWFPSYSSLAFQWVSLDYFKFNLSTYMLRSLIIHNSFLSNTTRIYPCAFEFKIQVLTKIKFPLILLHDLAKPHLISKFYLKSLYPTSSSSCFSIHRQNSCKLLSWKITFTKPFCLRDILWTLVIERLPIAILSPWPKASSKSSWISS